MQNGTTEIECTANFQPNAVLLNSGNLGYARVVLDVVSVKFFDKYLGKVEKQIDRTYLWMLLYDSVMLQTMTPKQYINLVILNIERETDEITITYIINRLKTLMKSYIKSEQ